MYMGCTLAYFAVVPVGDLLSAESGVIGLQFFSKVLGPVAGARIIPVMIGLAAFSCVMCISFASSRLIFDCARDGYFSPYIGRVLGRKSSFDTPLAALVVYAIITLAYIFGPPPGPTYELLIDLSSYPEWIFYGLSVLGLMVLNFTRKDLTDLSPIKAPFIGNAIFVLFCTGIMVVPFIPPDSNPYTLPYWTVPVLGMLIIILCCVWWYVQIILLKGMESSFNAKFGTHEDDLQDSLELANMISSSSSHTTVSPPEQAEQGGKKQYYD